MNEFEKFVNDLPNAEKEFDISAEMQSDSQPEESNNEETTQTEQVQDEDSLPFNKNPKIQRYIDRQIKKAIGQKPQQTEVKVVENKIEDVPLEWLTIYGDNEDARKAWGLQKKILDDYKVQVKQEALDSIRSEKERESAEVEQFQNFIDESLENIEDEHGIDLTSNSAQARKTRSEFLDLVQRLSPKDADGNVISYADFNAVYEVFSSKQSAPDQTVQRQKNLASRSLTQSAEATTVPKGYVAGQGFDGIKNALGL